MTENLRVELLIQQLEAALSTASRLKSKLVVELLRMAVLAAHESAETVKLDLDKFGGSR